MTNERAVALIVEAVRDPNMKQSASPLRKAIEAINIRHALSESELAEIQAKLQARGLSTQINSPQPEAAIQAIFLAMKADSDPQLNRDELYGDILETSLKLELMTVEKFGSRQGNKDRIGDLRLIHQRLRELQRLLNSNFDTQYSRRFQSLGLFDRLGMAAQYIEEMPTFDFSPNEAADLVEANKRYVGYGGGSAFESFVCQMAQVYENIFTSRPNARAKAATPTIPSSISFR